MHRRGFILGLGAAIAAPAIVRASSLMPVRALEPQLLYSVDTYFLDDPFEVLGWIGKERWRVRLFCVMDETGTVVTAQSRLYRGCLGEDGLPRLVEADQPAIERR